LTWHYQLIQTAYFYLRCSKSTAVVLNRGRQEISTVARALTCSTTGVCKIFCRWAI